MNSLLLHILLLECRIFEFTPIAFELVFQGDNHPNLTKTSALINSFSFSFNSFWLYYAAI